MKEFGSAFSRLRSDLSTMFGEQRRYEGVLRALVRRELLVRYKQTAIGIGWALLVPLLQMAVFTLVFTRAVPIETEYPYPVFAYVGLLPWNLFANAVRSSAGSMTDNPQLVTKVYFPREMLPFSTVLVGVVDFVLASSILAVLMMLYGVPISWTVTLVPVVLAVQLAFTAGVGLLIAMANLFYRDFRYVTNLLLMIWMFATSVVYPVERIGGRLGQVLTTVNPMTPILNAYRSLVLRGELPLNAAFGSAALVAFGTLFVGWIVFHRGEFRFAERI